MNLMPLTEQEEAIFSRAIAHYKESDFAEAIYQISDLAKSEFIRKMEIARSHPDYDQKIERQGFILAKFLLIDLATKFVKG